MITHAPLDASAFAGIIGQAIPPILILVFCIYRAKKIFGKTKQPPSIHPAIDTSLTKSNKNWGLIIVVAVISLLAVAHLFKNLPVEHLVFDDVGQVAIFKEDNFEARFPDKVYLLTTSSKTGPMVTNVKNYKSVVPEKGVFNVIVNDYSIDRPENISEDTILDLNLQGNMAGYKDSQLIETERINFAGYQANKFKFSFNENVNDETMKSVKEGIFIIASRRRVYSLSTLHVESKREEIQPDIDGFFGSFKIIE